MDRAGQTRVKSPHNSDKFKGIIFVFYFSAYNRLFYRSGLVFIIFR